MLSLKLLHSLPFIKLFILRQSTRQDSLRVRIDHWIWWNLFLLQPDWFLSIQWTSTSTLAHFILLPLPYDINIPDWLSFDRSLSRSYWRHFLLRHSLLVFGNIVTLVITYLSCHLWWSLVERDIDTVHWVVNGFFVFGVYFFDYSNWLLRDLHASFSDCDQLRVVIFQWAFAHFDTSFIFQIFIKI